MVTQLIKKFIAFWELKGSLPQPQELSTITFIINYLHNLRSTLAITSNGVKSSRPTNKFGVGTEIIFLKNPIISCRSGKTMFQWYFQIPEQDAWQKPHVWHNWFIKLTNLQLWTLRFYLNSVTEEYSNLYNCQPVLLTCRLLFRTSFMEVHGEWKIHVRMRTGWRWTESKIQIWITKCQTLRYNRFRV